MVFGICKGIDLVVPDIPETLDVKIKRERYLAKQALADAEHILQQVLNITLESFQKLKNEIISS